MSLQINDPITLSTFSVAAGAGLEVRGPEGQLLGFFNPAPRPGMMFPEFGVTDEEMDRRANDPNDWVSLDEVNARLRELRRLK